MGIGTNITSQQYRGNVANIIIMELTIEHPFWFDALHNDTPRVLEEDIMFRCGI
jgi:hypothetical protein